MSEVKERKPHTKITPPRDDYFMGLLMLASAACKDPTGQQAVFVVDNKDRWISFGINFMPSPNGYQNKKLEWNTENRNTAMVTAGESAIDRALKLYVAGSAATEPFVSHTMYISGPPTLRDVRRSGANGLKEIIYGPMKPQYFDEHEWEATKALGEQLGVRITPFSGNLHWIRDRVWSLSHLF